MKFKRVLSIFIALTMIVSVMTACVGESGEASSGNNITLRFWNIWGGGDANHAAVQKVINDFNRSHEGINVVVEYFENEAYKTMIRTAVAGDEVADVFSVWGAGFARPFYEADKLLSLDDYLKDGTLNKLYGGALSFFTYDGSYYGLTIGRNVSGFFVNTEVFENAGAKVPETWEELLEASEKILASGKIPIITSSRERWVMGMLFEGMVTKAVGAPVVNATINKQDDGGYSDPMYLETIKLLGELIDNRYINSDRAAITRDEALASFINGDAGLYYMGSWECSALEADDSAIAGKVSWIPFPTVPGGKGLATHFNGGAIDGLVVSANTAYPDEAAMFVKYFTENLSREGDYMPVWNTVPIDTTERPPVFAKIIEATENATDYVIWWDTFLEGNDVTIYQDALDKFVNGTITADQFAAEFVKIHP